MRIAAISALVALAALGCGGSDDGGAGGSGNSGSSGTGLGANGSSGTGFDTTSTGVGSTGSGGPNGGCSEAAQLVYVLSEENDLYSFKPDAKEFKKIGRLGCQTGMQPNSMAIDRDATAWVNYVQGGPGGDTAGAVFLVSTADASCRPTSIDLPDGWYRLGMGYSTDESGGTEERLFITGTGNFGAPSPGLGRIDPGASTVTPIGEFNGSLNGENAELTGTGDGRLFAFFTTSPVQVAELDKDTGATLRPTPLPGVETPTSWAFSFWGGDFYLYTAPDQGSFPRRTSNVTRFRPSDGSVDPSYMTNIGFRIVGAGVSTCAPVDSPR